MLYSRIAVNDGKDEKYSKDFHDTEVILAHY